MEEKITAWVARNENGNLYSFLYEKPIKIDCDSEIPDMGFWDYEDEGLSIGGGPHTIFILNKNLFPQVKWEDKEPTEVELTIKICK